MKWSILQSAPFPYSLEEVVSVFWDRYPNSFATHIVSEDVLERRVVGDRIFTSKLIVKEGNSILKRVPRWVSRVTDIREVATVEESIYDRKARTLVTLTRNVSSPGLFSMHERCVYTPVSSSVSPQPSTSTTRSVLIDFFGCRLSSLYENVLLVGYRKSIKKTVQGMAERLAMRYGTPLALPTTGRLQSQMGKLRDAIDKQTLITKVEAMSTGGKPVQKEEDLEEEDE